MYRYPTNLNKMPDASTQTTKGKNIFLLPKKKGFGEATVQLCWSCDTRPSTHRTYRDALDDYELTCDECHKDEYPEEYKVGFLCKNQDCSAVKTDEYNERCQICDGYFMDDGLNDILFIDEEPNRKHTQKKGTGCHLCGYGDEGVVRLKKTGEYICQDACPDSDDDDSSDEEEDERYCDNDDCPYGGYIYDEELEKYTGKEYKCIGCKTGKGLQEKEEERRQIMSDFKRVAEERVKEQFGSLSGFKVSCNF